MNLGPNIYLSYAELATCVEFQVESLLRLAKVLFDMDNNRIVRFRMRYK